MHHYAHTAVDPACITHGSLAYGQPMVSLWSAYGPANGPALTLTLKHRLPKGR